MLFFQTSSLSAFEVILLMKVEKKFKAACTVNYITEPFLQWKHEYDDACSLTVPKLVQYMHFLYLYLF